MCWWKQPGQGLLSAWNHKVPGLDQPGLAYIVARHYIWVSRSWIAKFKTHQIKKYGVLAETTKFNARQFFLLYGIIVLCTTCNLIICFDLKKIRFLLHFLLRCFCSWKPIGWFFMTLQCMVAASLQLSWLYLALIYASWLHCLCYSSQISQWTILLHTR